MEFFAFISAFLLHLSVPHNKNYFSLSYNNIIFVAIIAMVAFEHLFKETIFTENLILTVTYCLLFLIQSNSLNKKNNDFFTKFYLAIILAGFYNGFVILIQHYDLDINYLYGWILDYPITNNRPFGNFGQPNLASTLIASSYCCIIYFYLEKKISFISLIFCSIFFGSILALPASKSTVAALLLILTIAIILKQRKICIALANFFLSFTLSNHLHPNTRQLGSHVLNEEISSGRLDLWKAMLSALAEKPFIGYGTYNTKLAHFEIRENYPHFLGQVISSAHNIFLDLILWFGIIGGGLIIFPILLSVLFFAKSRCTSFGLMILPIPLLVHSQLEYPLYYANFLVLFATLFFARTDIFIINKILMPFIFVVCSVLFAIISSEYYTLSKRFTELRFHEARFKGAPRPEKIDSPILDITTLQYNIFLIENINSNEEYKKIQELTKINPSTKNYQLILEYLSKYEHNEIEYYYWKTKIKSSLNKEDFHHLQQFFRNSSPPSSQEL